MLDDLGEAYRLFTALGDGRQQRYTLDAIANLYADSRVAQYDPGSTLECKGSLEEALTRYRRGWMKARPREALAARRGPRRPPVRSGPGENLAGAGVRAVPAAPPLPPRRYARGGPPYWAGLGRGSAVGGTMLFRRM